MRIPLAPPGKALESIRVAARRRFVLASAALALGALAVSAALLFLRLRVEVAGLSGLIVGALLDVLGLASAAHAAIGTSRAFPLSEGAAASRRILVAAALLVLPAAALGALAWLALVAVVVPVLLPAHPFFWGPVAATAAAGLVLGSRELASERMSVVAAIGAGGVVGLALSAAGTAVADPAGTLAGPRLPIDLLLVALAFLAIGAAFERDPWAARSRRLG
ncbi:MAG TPA: hypothetical protein VJ326_09375 [Thermoplasmata archaeon]|nr:hypothetical protein [Thermoplasmata archaeon]